MSNITLATCEPAAGVIVNAGVSFSSTVTTLFSPFGVTVPLPVTFKVIV